MSEQSKNVGSILPKKASVAIQDVLKEILAGRPGKEPKESTLPPTAKADLLDTSDLEEEGDEPVIETPKEPDPLFTLKPDERLIQTEFTQKEKDDYSATFERFRERRNKLFASKGLPPTPDEPHILVAITEVKQPDGQVSYAKHGAPASLVEAWAKYNEWKASQANAVSSEGGQASAVVEKELTEADFVTEFFEFSGEPFQRTVTILDNRIRKDLYNNTRYGDRMVPYDHLLSDDYVDNPKNAKRVKAFGNKCTYPLERFRSILDTELKNRTQSEHEEENDADCPWEIFQLFIKTWEAVYRIDKEILRAEFESGVCSAQAIAAFLSEDPNRIVGIRVKGQIQGCKIRSASIESSIFSGPFISLSLKIIVHTGFGFMENQTNARLPYFAGTRPLEESGIYMLDKLPEVKQMLLERGKVYEQITLKPSYVNFHGAMTYSTWYGDQHYRCTGRAMVDLKAMQNMDSSYSQYHGIGDRSNRDNVPLDSVEPEALSEDKLLMTSPFVYGYSFSAKHWGEMVVSGISEIKFREDAYNRLVLDEDTKDLMFSLVATRSTTTSDLIDGKGGGCIFLLYGPPGVGKEVSLLMKKRQCRL